MKSPYDPPEESLQSEPLPPQPIPQGVIFIIILASISISWRLLAGSGLRGSGLLYIGMPTALAILLAYLPTPGSATGRIMKGITLFLLLTGILLIEGLICILIAAPLFYFVGLIIGIIADGRESRRKRNLNCSLGIALLFFSLEGLTGVLSFNRNETVIVEHQSELTLPEARAALAAGPDFDLTELPAFLMAGFPTPQDIAGRGIEPGDQWTIQWQGPDGLDPLIVEVVEASENRIVFDCMENDSKIGEWMKIKTVIWDLQPNDSGTAITMTLKYDRLLDPAWYFKPIQRYGVRKAGEYLISQTFREP
jgi:hypothetical protein